MKRTKIDYDTYTRAAAVYEEVQDHAMKVLEAFSQSPKTNKQEFVESLIDLQNAIFNSEITTNQFRYNPDIPETTVAEVVAVLKATHPSDFPTTRIQEWSSWIVGEEMNGSFSGQVSLVLNQFQRGISSVPERRKSIGSIAELQEAADTLSQPAVQQESVSSKAGPPRVTVIPKSLDENKNSAQLIAHNKLHKICLEITGNEKKLDESVIKNIRSLLSQIKLSEGNGKRDIQFNKNIIKLGELISKDGKGILTNYKIKGCLRALSNSYVGSLADLKGPAKKEEAGSKRNSTLQK